MGSVPTGPAPLDVSEITSWPASVVPRLQAWVWVLFLSIVTLAVPIAIVTGWIWARTGLLDRPTEHLPELRRTAFVCLPLAWLGGIPMMLVHTGAVWTPNESGTFVVLHLVTGLFGGMGYAACWQHAGPGRRGASPGPSPRWAGAHCRPTSGRPSSSVRRWRPGDWGSVGASDQRRPPSSPASSGWPLSCGAPPLTGRVVAGRPKWCCAA